MRSHWGSKLGFILATAGSAIGLGNIWRFPYLIGQYGGLFLLLYILCVVFLGYFLLTAKLTFGRIAQTNFWDGFQKVMPKTISKWWGRLGGSLTLFNIFLVSGVYVVVIGWTLSYVVWSGYNLVSDNALTIDVFLFEKLTSSYWMQLLWGSVCITVAGLILIKGVKNGIEKTSLYLMPLLFFLLIFMAGWMAFIPNAWKGLSYLFYVDLTKSLDEVFHIALLAMGQAIYSLSLGLGVCFIYGSYLNPTVNIKKSALYIVILDTIVALLASMIVLPAVFVFHLRISQGAGLSFVSLPLVFSQMVGGKFLMFLFFALLFIAALTSLISIYEPAINLFMEKRHYKRVTATAIVMLINLILSAIFLASFTNVFNVTCYGKNLFDFADYLTGSYTMGLLIALYSIFMGWKIWPQISDNLCTSYVWYKSYMKLLLKWLVPLSLGILFIVA